MAETHGAQEEVGRAEGDQTSSNRALRLLPNCGRSVLSASSAGAAGAGKSQRQQQFRHLGVMPSVPTQVDIKAAASLETTLATRKPEATAENRETQVIAVGDGPEDWTPIH